MQRQQTQENSLESGIYVPYFDSNPSSTHSSPRSYPADLNSYYPPLHSQTYPIPTGVTSNNYSFPHRRPQLPPSKSSSYGYSTTPVPPSAPVSLQVSTSTSSHEHDPNECTARPGNAHHHMEFHTALGASSSSILPDGSGEVTAVKSEFNGNGTDSMSGGIPISAGDSGGHPTDNSTSHHIPSSIPHHTMKDYTSSIPGFTGGLTRPLKPIERERLAHLDRLKFFLATAPSRWDDAAENAAPTPSLSSMGEDELAGGVGTTPPHPFMSGTVPYGPGSFGSSYPSQYPPIESSSGPSTSTTSSTYRNTFTPFSNSQPISDPMQQHLSHLRAPAHPALNRFLLPNQEFVTCVLWNGLYHISGTDIVRALVFRFEVSKIAFFILAFVCDKPKSSSTIPLK